MVTSLSDTSLKLPEWAGGNLQPVATVVKLGNQGMGDVLDPGLPLCSRHGDLLAGEHRNCPTRSVQVSI